MNPTFRKNSSYKEIEVFSDSKSEINDKSIEKPHIETISDSNHSGASDILQMRKLSKSTVIYNSRKEVPFADLMPDEVLNKKINNNSSVFWNIFEKLF